MVDSRTLLFLREKISQSLSISLSSSLTLLKGEVCHLGCRHIHRSLADADLSDPLTGARSDVDNLGNIKHSEDISQSQHRTDLNIGEHSEHVLPSGRPGLSVLSPDPVLLSEGDVGGGVGRDGLVVVTQVVEAHSPPSPDYRHRLLQSPAPACSSLSDCEVPAVGGEFVTSQHSSVWTNKQKLIKAV